MKKYPFFYRNSLSIVFLTLFIVTLAGQVLTGWKQHNSDLKDAHQSEISLGGYLHTGHCISSTFENFQSEFLQMALYVILTIPRFCLSFFCQLGPSFLRKPARS